jgi:hypothetical protein
MAPWLVSTIYKSLGHTLSSQSDFTNRFLVTNLNTVEILQLMYSSRCPLVNSPQLTHFFSLPTPRLAAISQQTPSLLFTD